MGTKRGEVSPVEAAARAVAKRVRDQYGAGWDRIGSVAQANAIAHVVLMDAITMAGASIQRDVMASIFFRAMVIAGVAREPAAASETEPECKGHPAGSNGPMGQTTYCDGSCRKAEGSR